jgi:hypothetical protein
MGKDQPPAEERENYRSRSSSSSSSSSFVIDLHRQPHAEWQPGRHQPDRLRFTRTRTISGFVTGRSTRTGVQAPSPHEGRVGRGSRRGASWENYRSRSSSSSFVIDPTASGRLSVATKSKRTRSITINDDDDEDEGYPHATVVASLSPRGTSGERIKERGFLGELLESVLVLRRRPRPSSSSSSFEIDPPASGRLSAATKSKRTGSITIYEDEDEGYPHATVVASLSPRGTSGERIRRGASFMVPRRRDGTRRGA